MAVAYVKNAVSAEGSSVSSISTSAFSGSTSNGNTIAAIAYIFDPDGTPPTNFSFTDAKSNTYNTITNAVRTFGVASAARCEMEYATNITGGTSHTVSVSPGDTGLYITLGAIEMSGVDTATPVDQSGNNAGNSTTPAVSITPTANGLFLAAVGYDASATTITEEGSPWTLAYELDENNDAMAQNVIYNAATNGSGDTANWTLGDARQWGVIAAVFKEAAGGATGHPAIKRAGGVPYMASLTQSGARVW